MSIPVSQLAQLSRNEVRKLLSAVKMVIDLERIGDVLAYVAGCARALGSRVDAGDMADMVRMASFVEHMQ